VVGGLTVAAVVAGIVGVGALGDSVTGHSAVWDPRVADLARFVEDERGLTFDHPVTIDFLSEEAYRQRSRADAVLDDGEDRSARNAEVTRLRALGLASGDVDMAEVAERMGASGTLAYYDPARKRVNVRGTDLTLRVEVTLVHELTHVLQDQNFDLARIYRRIAVKAAADLDRRATGDAAEVETAMARSSFDAAVVGFQALIEGDAVRVANAYVDELPAAEQEEYLADLREAADRAEDELNEVPNALLAFRDVPYSLGQPLVDLVAADGSNSAVDAMIDDLPATEEHLLNPLTYLDSQGPGDLDLPSEPVGAAETRGVGTMGAVELYLVLGQRIDPLVALEAADGWSNATFRSYDEGGRSCVDLVVDGDTPGDDQQLASAFAVWAAAAEPATGTRATPRGDGTTQVHACDPGPDGPAVDARARDLLQLAGARSRIAASTAAAGRHPEAAWAAGDCFVHEVTLDQIITANELGEPYPAELQAVIDHALSTCDATK
jgi:hypothetical protein